MDKERKCDAHGERAAAYCRVHKILLCTKCLINNVHKVEECKLCETHDILPTDNLYLDLKSFENTIKERIDIQKAEQKSLEDLHKALGSQVEACYGSLIASLEEMKQGTLDYLDESINRRNVDVVRRSDILLQCQAKVLEYMDGVDCNAQNENQDPINIEGMEKELKSLKAKVNKSSPSFLKSITGTFIPYTTMLTFPDKVLGDIEFSDELYEHVGELDLGPSQAAKGQPNAASDKANELDSIRVNKGEVDGGPPNPVLFDTAPARPMRMPKPPDVETDKPLAIPTKKSGIVGIFKRSKFGTNKPQAIPPKESSSVGEPNSITNGSDIYETVAKNPSSSGIPPIETGTVGKNIFITDGSDAYEKVARCVARDTSIRHGVYMAGEN